MFSNIGRKSTSPVPFLSSVAKEIPHFIASAGFFIDTSKSKPQP